MSLKILITGEIVGNPGIIVMKDFLSKLKKEYKVDFVISQNNFTTGLKGLGKKHAFSLKKFGVDVLTLADNAFVRNDLGMELDKYSFILRPLNYPTRVKGFSYCIYNIGTQKLAVINLIGQTGYNKHCYNSPFFAFDYLYNRIKNRTNNIIVIFNSNTTAEKNTMFFHLKSRISACIGTGSRILTADPRILDGMAVISDVGRVGSLDSVLGYSVEEEVDKFLKGQFFPKYMEAWDGLGFNGVLVDLANNGTAKGIELIKKLNIVQIDRKMDT